MMLALTHAVPTNTDQVEVSFIKREAINHELALRQHDAYCLALERHGVKVKKLTANAAHPDACFVEDLAIVIDEVAVITSMGVASRRDEPQVLVPELAPYRELAQIHPPATLEGGDVLRLGKNLFVGLTRRTNIEGIKALSQILTLHGYKIIPVEVNGCLHLKTACTAIDEETVLLNPRCVVPESFGTYKQLFVPAGEESAANTLRVGETVFLDAAFPRTWELINQHYNRVEALDISEFRKMEAGLSCLSILFEQINTP
jgi:dimethylargininase